jgi:hypothetical protein
MTLIKKKTLLSVLGYMKQQIHGIGASKGAGHFPKEQYV